MTNRPVCYPEPPPAALAGASAGLPGLDVLTSPVPQGRFDSPTDHRHVLCLHLGQPVSVSYRAGRHERQGVRLHGQFCVVPAGSSTRWTLTAPATSLLLRLNPGLLRDTADAMGVAAPDGDLAPAIHIRDPQIERIGWLMQAEAQEGYLGGRLFADSLATALAARLLAVQSHGQAPAVQGDAKPGQALPSWRMRQVLAYIEDNLDQDLSLAQLAAVANFSPSHFKALFRQAAGMPVHRFVLERRVQRARELVLRGGQSMTDIALACGFAHASHMARCMRRLQGHGPAQLIH